MVTEEEYRKHLLVTIEFLKNPANVRGYFDKSSQFKIYQNLSNEEFCQFAKTCTKRFVNIKDFYPRLRDILENAIRLETLGVSTRYHLQKQRPENEEYVNHLYEQQPFKVYMEDQMSWEDFIRRDAALKLNGGNSADYQYQSEKLIISFVGNEKAKNFFATSPNHTFVIKGNFQTEKNIAELIKTDTAVFTEFTNLSQILVSFFACAKPPYTQEAFQRHWFMKKFEGLEKGTIDGCDFPLIMYLVDNTRRFLAEALIKEHWKDIAPSIREAQQHLKQNKNSIYTYATQFGYIGCSEPYEHCETFRNAIAHNREGVHLAENGHKVIRDIYVDFISHFLDYKSLQKLYEEIPLLFQLEEINHLNNSYEIIRRSEAIISAMNQLLPEELQKKTLKEKMQYLKNHGLMDEIDKKTAESVFLKRNPIAHGQSKEIIKQAFSSVPQVAKLCQRLVHQQENLRC